MLVILAPEAYDSWMDPDLADPERLKAFLKPYPKGTKRRLTKRLRILCGNATPSPEQIVFLTDCARLGSGGEEVLRTWLREHPSARLIVIDTLPAFGRTRIPRKALPE